MDEQSEIYRLEIDTGDADKRLAELNKLLDANKTRIAVLQAQQKAGIKLTDQERNEALKLNQANKSLAKEQQNLIKIQTEENGSLNEQRAVLIELRRQYDALTKAERENINVGGRLKKEINEVNDAVTKAETGTGRYGRVVGQYAKEIGGALVGTGKFGQALGAVAKISAGGILGVVVAAMSALVAVFSKAQPVIDRINVLMSGMSAVADVLVQRVGLLFTAFGKLFSGDVSGAVDTAASAFTGLGKAISDASSFGQAFAETMKLIEDNGQALEVQEARNSAQIAQLNAQLRDRSRTEAERIKIAKQIQALEEDTFKQRDQLLRQELNLQQSQLKRLLLDKGIAEAADANAERLIILAQEAQIEDAKWIKLKEQLVKVYQNEEQSLALIERTQTRLNQVNEQSRLEDERRAAEREKQSEKQKKEIEDRAKFQAEAFQMLLDAELKTLDQSAKQQEVYRKAQLAADLEAATTDKQRAEIQQQYEADVTSTKALNLQAQIEALRLYQGEVSGIDQQIADKEIELSALVTDAKLKDINDQIKAQQDAAKKSEAIAEKQAEAQKQIFAGLANQIGADIAAAVDAVFTKQEDASEQFLASIFTTTLDAIEQVLVAQQAAAIAATTFQEIATKGLAGLLTAAINIAVIKGAFAVAKSAIKSAILPKAETGGLLIGARHSQGGIPIEAEGGEYIVNRKATSMFLPQLQAMNSEGLKYQGGGVVPTIPNITAPSPDSAISIIEALKGISIYTDITEVRNAAAKQVRVTNRRKL